MLRSAAILAGALLLSLVALVAIVVLGFRVRSARVLDGVRRVNRALFNPVQMKSAGTQGAYAGVVRHRGRASGRPYATPVVPVPTDDGFVIALPYGLRADWMKNVLAAGTATIVHEGRAYDVERPEIISMEEGRRWFPPGQQRSHDRFGIENCLRVRRVGSPGADEGGADPAADDAR